MQYIRAIKDKSARHIMLGISIFAILFLVVIGLSLFLKALPIMKEKNLWTLLTSADWKPFKGDFGFLPYIMSTLYVSSLAFICIRMHRKPSAGFFNQLSICFQVYPL
jgi:phosphate transport system permease protein